MTGIEIWNSYLTRPERCVRHETFRILRGNAQSGPRIGKSRMNSDNSPEQSWKPIIVFSDRIRVQSMRWMPFPVSGLISCVGEGKSDDSRSQNHIEANCPLRSLGSSRGLVSRESNLALFFARISECIIPRTFQRNRQGMRSRDCLSTRQAAEIPGFQSCAGILKKTQRCQTKDDSLAVNFDQVS
jgi:hypothetical protein